MIALALLAQLLMPPSSDSPILAPVSPYGIMFQAPGGVARPISSKLGDVVSVLDYGAKCDGTSFDDTAGIQAAITYAGTIASFGGDGTVVELPAGTCNLSGSGAELVLINHQIILRGKGFLSTVLKVAASVPGSTDVIHVRADFNMQGGGLEDFRIAPVSGTPARYGVNVDATSFGIGGYFISRLFISPFGGGKAIYGTNPIPNVSGWYSSTIRDCILQQGIQIDNAGDNMNIERNLITGTGVGIDMSHVVGSAGMIIRQNFIRNTAGQIHLRGDVESSRIMENECVGNVSDTGSNNASIDIDGSSGHTVNHIEIAQNVIQPVQTTLTAVRVNWANHANIHDNTMWRSGVGAFHITVTANAADTMIGFNRYNPTTDTWTANILSDAGASTTWYNQSLAGTGAVTASRFSTGKTAPPANVGFQAAAGGGSWSSANYGKQFIVDNISTSSNPAIGLFDSGNGNPWAIANNSGALLFLSMPAITDSTTAANESFRITTSGVKISGGLANNGNGFEHVRNAGCATAAAAGATCTSVVTWPTAFVNANYTVSCMGDLVTSGVPLNGGITVKATGSVTFQTVAATAAAAQYTTIDCVAPHD